MERYSETERQRNREIKEQKDRGTDISRNREIEKRRDKGMKRDR